MTYEFPVSSSPARHLSTSSEHNWALPAASGQGTTHVVALDVATIAIADMAILRIAEIDLRMRFRPNLPQHLLKGLW